MRSVTINPPKTPVTKGSSGIAAATLPNVCKMPGPPAPFVPTPLPNIGNSGSSPQGYSTSVTIEGQPVAIAGASFGSSGDVASQATGGGLISSNTQGPTKFIGPGSFNVQIEGKNVQLLGDPMLNNCGPSGAPANAGTMTGVIQSPGDMKIIYGDDKPCGRCGKTHPLEAGEETLKMIRTLTKALKRKFEEQKARIKELSELNASLDEAKERRRGFVVKERREGLGLGDQMQLFKARAVVSSLETRRDALVTFFEGAALFRWDPKTDTYSKGYMMGAMTCICRTKKLAACSGKAPPAFIGVVDSGGWECASPPVGPGPDERWSCAGKRLVDQSAGHRPIQMIERWFFPQIRGLRIARKPKITFSVLIEDHVTHVLTVESRIQRFDTRQNVPSCDRCQTNLAEIYCDDHC